jgi:hypothetical protein
LSGTFRGQGGHGPAEAFLFAEDYRKKEDLTYGYA